MKSVVKHSNIGSSNEYRSLYIQDYHGEYPIPTMNNVHVRDVWDGFDAQEIIAAALFDGERKYDNEELNKLVEKAFRKIVFDPDRYEGEPYMINDENDISDEVFGHIRCITIWGNNQEETLNKYLDLYESEVRQAIENASGDDSFFDYMPNFVDTFRQICELFGYKDRYNKMIQEYLLNDSDYEFYVEKI